MKDREYTLDDLLLDTDMTEHWFKELGLWDERHEAFAQRIRTDKKLQKQMIKFGNKGRIK